MKKRGIKKVIEIDFKSLTHFVDDTQLDRIIGTVDDITDRGFWYTASLEKLVLGHVTLL